MVAACRPAHPAPGSAYDIRHLQFRPSAWKRRPRAVYDPALNQGIERLMAVGEKANLGKLDCIPRLAEIDAECAVFKVRQITERLCRRILQATGRWTLDQMIGDIESRRLLGKKAIYYLRAVQNLGNGATHNTDDLFDDEYTMKDVNSVADALAHVLEAAYTKKLLPRA